MEWKYFNAQDQEIQKSAFCRKSDVDAVLALQWDHPQVVPGSSTDGQKCTVLC